MFATKFQSAFRSLKKQNNNNKKLIILAGMSPFICKNIKEVTFARMDRRIAGFDREGEKGRGREA